MGAAGVRKVKEAHMQESTYTIWLLAEVLIVFAGVLFILGTTYNLFYLLTLSIIPAALGIYLCVLEFRSENALSGIYKIRYFRIVER